MNEQEALVALNAIPGLGPSRIKDLIESFGSAKEIFPLKIQKIKSVSSIPFSLVEKICQFDADKFLKSEYHLMHKHKIEILTIFDEDYPALLKEIPGAPYVLYIKGKLKREYELAIGMVGSRRASQYGIGMASKLSRQLSERGMTIVSGLARGIDTASHQSVLKARGTTLAVLGCGLSQIYPPENAELANLISQHGACLSEFPMETLPLAKNFPRRNRIISGLSVGIVIVEASYRSGALITGRYALEQGRDVFAVPGRADSIESLGCHNFIKQGAKLVVCFEDILEELLPQLKSKLNEITSEESKFHQDNQKEELSDKERQICDILSKEKCNIDELSIRTQQPVAMLMKALLKLELNHHIKQTPGKSFVCLN